MNNKPLHILILGATSAIARATAEEFAAGGHHLFLASRDTDELGRIANDLTIRFALPVAYGKFDADDFATHENFLHTVLEKIKHIDGVLLAFGDLAGDPQSIIKRNFSGAVSILNHCADYLTQQKQGFIAAISSVAGDRGRQSNYHYGAAKAGLTTYLQGLRNQLFPLGVHVITIKPGPVDTAMIFGRAMPLVASPKKVAKDIFRAIAQRKDVVYTPWFWRYIMLVIKLIPERLFKKLRL